MANARRRAILRIPADTLGEFLRNGEKHFMVEGGLPKNAKFLGAWFDHSRQCFDAAYEDASFKPVAKGAKMPILPPPVIHLIHK